MVKGIRCNLLFRAWYGKEREGARKIRNRNLLDCALKLKGLRSRVCALAFVD